MGDILLIFPPDKKAAANDIAQALAQAGYRAASSPVEDGSRIAALAVRAEAALLIWSRGLALAATTEGWFGGLRRLSNLIELSTDGIAPQEGDESRVILLSGWRGQPFHLGWQRVLAELDRLGARRASVQPAATPANAATAPPTEARTPEAAARAGAVPAPNPGTAARKYALPAAAALALAGGLAAAAWVSERSPLPPPAAREPAPVAAPPAVLSSTPVAASGAAAPAAAASEEPHGAVPQAVSPPLTATNRPERAAAAVTKQARPKPARAAVRAASRPVAVKRYTKRGAKVMRRFCARSGRNTHECRVFRASTAPARS
jgi:hypothetical protein